MKACLTGCTDCSDLCDHDDLVAFIGIAAGESTARHGSNEQAVKRALSCVAMGHDSVLEHVSFTWRVSGISRACSHQLVRHRLMSFTQRSQRYTAQSRDYVVPKALEQSPCLEAFDTAMAHAFDAYEALLEAGVKPEDARYVLPEGATTSLVVSCNLRELVSFLRLRTDAHAQQEIRDLAHAMRQAVLDEHPELATVLVDGGGE